jgi:hypothetical protein
MHYIAHVVCNAGEPDNLLEFWYAANGCLVRAESHAQFRDGVLHALIERTADGWYAVVDGQEYLCASLDTAWAHLPALLTTPDYWYPVRPADV